MSSSGSHDAFNGKLQTVADLEKAAIDLEKNLTNLNKSYLRKLLKGFASLTNALESTEPGIFSTVIRWYRLYLRVQISIDPDNEKFLNYFEKTIPTAITYIIGCLQHKTKEIQNYHYSLLEIIEQLLENVKPNIFNSIINLETGTIACLWNPIDYAGDYNTQFKALQILSLFLKHLDNDKQNEELKTIKWTNLNLFQEKLKTIIQESKLATVFDTTARELLNNYNMNLSKNVRVYSFYCQSLTLGTKYKIYKPLNLDKFWIDINYCPQTLSFNGRFKLDSKSKYEQINVILKIKNIKMENKQLLINYHKPGEFSKYCKEISEKSENFIQFTLNHEEEQRFKENHFVMDYFNNNNIVDTENPPSRRTSDVFQKSYNLLIGSSPNETAPEHKKNNKSDAKTFESHNHTNKQTKPVSSEVSIVWVESPKSSRIPPDTVEKQPIRKMPYRKRKFFASLLEDEDFESEEESRKAPKKKSKVKKPRQPKTTKKQVCKVSPIVDLTGIDDVPHKENVQKSYSSIQHITNDINDGAEKCIPSSDILTTQQCSTILKTVSDIYNVGDTTYAEPCQSYRNFKTQRVPGTVKSSIDKKPAKTRGRKPKRETSNVENITADKENIDPNIVKSVKNVKGKHALANNKSMISPNVFGTPNSDEVVPTKRPRPSIDKTVYTLDMEVDLTADDPIDPEKQPLNPKPSAKDICTIHQLSKSSSYENILNDDLLDYEAVRIDGNSIAHPTAISTPNITKLYSSNNASPTSTMNVSDINDSDMELTQLTNRSNYIMNKFRNKELSPKKQQLTVVEQILNDWNFDDVESIQKPNENEQCTTESKTLEDVNNNDADNVVRQCVVFQKRFDDDESDSSDNNDIAECVERQPSIDFLKQPDFMINEDFVIMQNMSLNINPNYYNLDHIWNTPDKNNIIVRNVSTKSSTECQVTPNALILRQFQVSTKESVLVADLKKKHQYPYCKAKKSLNGFYNNRSVCSNNQSSIKGTLKPIDPANEDGNLDNNNNIICPYEKPPKRTYFAFKAKSKQIETSNSLVPLSLLNNLNITNGNHINKAVETTIVNSNGTGKDLIPLQNNNSIVQNRCHYNKVNKTLTLETKDKQQNVGNCENTLKPSSITKTIFLQENVNTKENTNLENTFLLQNSIYYDEHETLDTRDNYSNEIETIADQRSSLYNNNYSAENIENLNNNNSIDNVISLFCDENNAINRNTEKSSESENKQDFFENELSQLEHDYNAKMQKRIENARRLCLTNTADLYQQKILEITESVLRKSEEQKKELELLRKNIECLVTRMEWQYQIFIKKSKLYDNYKEITERSLNAFAELNVQQRITAEYQELENQLKIDQNEVLQEVWQNYIEKKKKDYLNNIDNLSKI